MKKTITLLFFYGVLPFAFTQMLNIDSVYQKFASETDESKRLKALNTFFAGPETKDPMLDLQYAQRIMILAHKNNDKISEALALSQIGWDYISFGNTLKGLEYRLKSIEVAEKSNNLEMLGDSKLHLGLYFYEQNDFQRAITFGYSGNETAVKANNEIMQTWAYWLLGDSYYSINKLDSALMFAQRAYDICQRIKYFDYIDWTYASLGKIQGKLGNHALAIGYFDLAIKESLRKNSLNYLNKYYTAMAQYYLDRHQTDSCIVYARKAVEIVQNTRFASSCLVPAKLLLDAYKTVNVDSAFKYSELYRISNDSLFSANKIKQANLMTFTEDLRQQELAESKLKAEEERKHNIQLSLLAIGILTFIILFLLLSRSFIINSKQIEFFGVIALLLMFEFLNLVLHPFLERITHHTPVLMLLAMVLIAAVLVPFHHKAEKWTTKKLVEKNNAIRLAHAKKTIMSLEGETPIM